MILVKKARAIPLIIRILGAILRRLRKTHPKFQQLSEELGRRQAGYQGEKSLDYYYRSLPKKYWLFHDLNLPDGDFNCQIDTLLLTPEHIQLIDVKHMAGKLVLDTDNEQFTQINNGTEKGYLYPIAQGERHQKFIMDLLAEHHFPSVPVEYIVVFSNGYSSYSITGKNAVKIRHRVCKADVLLNRIQHFEKLYSKPLLTAKDLNKLSKLLIKLNTPPTNFILQKFGIEKSDFITGVQCPPCLNVPLIRKNRKWFCPSCQSFSKDAHIDFLKDYFLLYDLKITNQQFREHSHIDSIDTAKRLLHSANLKSSGTNKHRVYFPEKFPW